MPEMGLGMQCGNGNDSMGVGREWEQDSTSRPPLLLISVDFDDDVALLLSVARLGLMRRHDLPADKNEFSRFRLAKVIIVETYVHKDRWT